MNGATQIGATLAIEVSVRLFANGTRIQNRLNALTTNGETEATLATQIQTGGSTK